MSETLTIQSDGISIDSASYAPIKQTALLAEKPKRKRASRRMPELWAVVEMPDGSRQAYTFVTKAIQAAGEAGVRTVQLCRIVPKTRGFKVVETVSI